MNRLTDKYNICVITSPFQDMVGETIFSNFIDIHEPLSIELFVTADGMRK